MELDTPGRPVHLFPRIEDDSERAAWLLALLDEDTQDPWIRVHPKPDESDLDDLEDEMDRALKLARDTDPNIALEILPATHHRDGGTDSLLVVVHERVAGTCIRCSKPGR